MSQGKNAQVQKRGKSWQYRIQYFTEEGKRESVSRSGYATRKEAKEAGDKVASELSSNKIIPEVVKDNPSTKEFYEFWLESYCSSNVKESTRRGYVKNLKNLIYPYIKEIPLRELNAATLQNLLDILLEKGYALNRIRAVKGMFTGGLDFAVRMQLIAVNPAKSIRMPNVRKVMESSPESVPKERRPIAEWEWEVIIGRYPEGVSAHFPLICGYRLGNRLGETFGYTWDDVNWSRRSISVNRQVVDKVHTDENGCHWYIALPKYESMREIELDDATYELLKSLHLRFPNEKAGCKERDNSENVSQQNLLRHCFIVPISKQVRSFMESHREICILRLANGVVLKLSKGENALGLSIFDIKGTGTHLYNYGKDSEMDVFDVHVCSGFIQSIIDAIGRVLETKNHGDIFCI